jgi:hypothetical protein
MHMRLLDLAGGAIVALALSGSAAQAAGIINGGFEDASIAPWTVGPGGTVTAINSFSAPDGAKVALITFDAYFDGGATSLSQTFEADAEGLFDYAFKAGRAEGIGPFNDVGLTFAARIDGALLSSALPSFDGSGGNYTQFTQLLSSYSGSTFLTQGSHTLTFEFSRAGTGFGRSPYFLLDGVSVTAQAAPDPGPGAAVPEPATWALMIAGFGLAGASLRRRRAVVA